MYNNAYVYNKLKLRYWIPETGCLKLVIELTRKISLSATSVLRVDAGVFAKLGYSYLYQSVHLSAFKNF